MRLGSLLATMAVVGCGGVIDAPVIEAAAPALRDVNGRFPVQPCAEAQDDERVGVWQAGGESTFVYDGCSVRFVYSFTVPPEMAMFTGMRNIARAFVVDARDYADPMPYFRARAIWHGEWLTSTSILGTRDVARWDGERFTWRDREQTYARVESVDELTPSSRDLLFTDRFIPTEEELAAERGVPMPPPDAPPLDYLESMMCPTGRCEEQEKQTSPRSRR